MMRAAAWARDGRDWPLAAHSRFVATPGLCWHVQVLGAETAPVMLLLHGTGAATHSWRDCARLWAEHWRVIVPDLPGHGFTTGRPAGGMTMPAIARALGDLLRALAAEPVIIVGHSAGAAIALRMALDHVVRASALVGVGAAITPIPGLGAALFPTLARLLFVNPLAPHVFAQFASRPGEVARFLLRSTGSHLDAAGIRYYQRLFARPDHCAGAIALMASWDLDTLARDLPRIATPLLLLHGARDAAIAPAGVERAARAIACARLVMLDHCGHLAHEEQPAEIAARVNAFAREIMP